MSNEFNTGEPATETNPFPVHGPVDSHVQTGVSGANDLDSFDLIGGLYQIQATGTFSGGSVVLEQRAADDVTWLTVSNPITANGGQTLYLPPGKFRWAVTGSADPLALQVSRIPQS